MNLSILFFFALIHYCTFTFAIPTSIATNSTASPKRRESSNNGVVVSGVFKVDISSFACPSVTDGTTCGNIQDFSAGDTEVIQCWFHGAALSSLSTSTSTFHTPLNYVDQHFGPGFDNVWYKLSTSPSPSWLPRLGDALIDLNVFPKVYCPSEEASFGSD